MADSHKNFAYSLVATAPSPAATGTSLVVTAAEGAKFPAAPFNATIWPASAQPTSTNSEIVRVTAVSTDTLTITRAQEGTGNRTVIVGDQIAATITAKTLTDVENVLIKWSPFILASSGHTFQTLASDYTGQTGTGSLFVFPVTVPENIQFNMVLVPNSISYVTTAIGAASNSYYSKFGIYSMTGNTLSLISSNSFSIAETVNSVSLSWNFPTTTLTSGYGYGSFAAGGTAGLTTTAQMVSYISGTRIVGLQFGGNISLSDGVYFMGIMSMRSKGDSRSTHGLSNVGLIGNPVNSINQAGSVSGLLPIGVAGSAWTASNSHSSFWFGRHILGFMTATSITNQLGSAIPDAITLSALGGVAAASTATVLPTITFISTGA